MSGHLLFSLNLACSYSFWWKKINCQEMRGTPVQSGVRCMCGIICKSKALKFERMLFRATRGNLLFNQAPADVYITDPTTSETVSILENSSSYIFLFPTSICPLLLKPTSFENNFYYFSLNTFLRLFCFWK